MNAKPLIPDALFREIHQLADGMLDGTLCDEQIERLDRLVCADTVARQLYVRYIFNSDSLRTWSKSDFSGMFAEDEAFALSDLDKDAICREISSQSSFLLGNYGFHVLGNTFSNTIGYFSHEIPFSFLVGALLTGLLVLVAWLVPVSGPVELAQNGVSISPVVKSKTEFVGQITGMLDVKWANEYTIAFGDTRVPLGRKYALASGLMEITYDTGAKVILQGPVTYEVDSRDGGFLSVGKLTARLEKKQSAISGQQSWLAASMANQKSEIINHKSPLSPLPSPLFTIKTPTATVTDLSTEFGVEVRESGITFAHVYRGAVDVRANYANSHGGSIRLAADESVEVRSVGAKEAPTVRRATVDPSAFVRTEQFLRLAGEQKFKALRRWQDYMDKLRRDPALVVHYDFQKKDDSPNILHGVTRSSDSRLDGVIDGAMWADGRMPGKNALEFDGVNTHVKVKLPQRLTQITIAAWVTIGRINDSGGTDYHGVASGLLMSEGWGKQGDSSEKCHWQITRAGEIYFGTPDYNVRTPEVLPWQQWGRNRWRHLAVATDPVHRQIACYLDGKQVLATEFSERFAVAFNDATIGSWKTDAGTIERGLCGRMDDLVIFSRAMTTQEIRDMYEAGKP